MIVKTNFGWWKVKPENKNKYDWIAMNSIDIVKVFTTTILYDDDMGSRQAKAKNKLL